MAQGEDAARCAAHLGSWDIRRYARHWEAVRHPTPTALHVVVARDVTELADKLDQEAR